MPIYEYLCKDCEERFDALRPIAKADAPIACVKCGGADTSRAISVFFARSEGRVVAGSNGGCASCSSSSCASCGH